MGVEEKIIRGLKWSKLLDPDKKGQWWSSVDMASARDDVEEVASTIDKELLEAQKMLELAAAQRMNTDARKAIFCIIMSGEDYIDTFEKLLRLDLPGKQVWLYLYIFNFVSVGIFFTIFHHFAIFYFHVGLQDREIMRVLVECCLQEKVFNKYYAVLATKLCEHDKNHKFTLQVFLSPYCGLRWQMCRNVWKYIKLFFRYFLVQNAPFLPIFTGHMRVMFPCEKAFHRCNF